MKIHKNIVILLLLSGVTIEAMQGLRNLGQRLMQQAPEIRTAAQQTWQSARTRVQPVAEAAQSEIAAMRAPGAQEDAMAQLSEQFNTSKAQALKDGFNNFKDSIFKKLF